MLVRETGMVSNEIVPNFSNKTIDNRILFAEAVYIQQVPAEKPAD
jgi:hypothetical protein